MQNERLAVLQYRVALVLVRPAKTPILLMSILVALPGYAKFVNKLSIEPVCCSVYI